MSAHVGAAWEEASIVMFGLIMRIEMRTDGFGAV